MEIITRTERRRKWTDEEREQILAECNRSDTTVKQVAQRYDVAESVSIGAQTGTGIGAQ